jgi:hypothetical protein
MLPSVVSMESQLTAYRASRSQIKFVEKGTITQSVKLFRYLMYIVDQVVSLWKEKFYCHVYKKPVTSVSVYLKSSKKRLEKKA